MKAKTFFSILLMSLFANFEIFAQSASIGESLARGVTYVAVYALLGLALMIISFRVIDFVIPGRLANLIADDKNIAAAIVMAGALIGISIIIAASIVG